MNNKGKVVSIKKNWVVKSKVVDGEVFHITRDTREEARRVKRIHKGNRYLENTKMYKTTEIEFADGQIILSMERAR